jgi:hypothetical protein
MRDEDEIDMDEDEIDMDEDEIDMDEDEIDMNFGVFRGAQNFMLLETSWGRYGGWTP